MSRYGTVVGGTAFIRTAVVQSASPDDLAARVLAAYGLLATGLTSPVVSALTLAGAGSGHMFFVELEVGEAADVNGGVALTSVRCFLGSTAEAIERARDALASATDLADVQIAGGSLGQRVMGLAVFGDLLSGLSPSAFEETLFTEDWTVGGTAGSFSWIPNLAVVGSAVSLVGTPYITPNHQGVLRMGTGTTATGRAGVRTAINLHNVGLGGNSMSFEAMSRLDTLSTVTEEYFFQNGWTDATFGGLFGTGAIQFVYNRAANGPNWQAFARRGLVSTIIDTSIPVVAGGWFRMRIEVDPIEARFLMSEPLVLVATMPQAVLPVASMGISCKIEKTAGTSLREAVNDYMQWGARYPSGRLP